ncbi:MAG: cbb3-type cytochrome c oxidase subunit II [Gemmatimonadaceae bacterium]|nr:cbb3-type cytochrome c oxidase subunit II [Gemmatimonadaceae bacterium]
MRLDFHEDHRLLFGTVLAGFVALSVVVAVAPAAWLQRAVPPTPGSRPLTALEQRGLDVYLSEGCVYCHTQQVRPLAQDTTRYGRASIAGDYARLRPTGPFHPTPRVLGTERTGPDLSNIAARQPSAVWHYLHLYQPRAVVQGSVMPSFPWLFEVRDSASAGDSAITVPAPYAPTGGVVVPRESARALVAYLLALRSASLPSSSSAPASGVVRETAAPVATPTSTDDGSAWREQGAKVYASNCAACHQPLGTGLPGTFPPLAGDAMVTAADPTRHIETVLFGASGSTIGGVRYTSPMPAWGATLSDADIAAVINHERSSWGNRAPLVSAADVATIRAQGGRRAQ